MSQLYFLRQTLIVLTVRSNFKGYNEVLSGYQLGQVVEL
jgi:hypothetical protein